MPKRKIGCGREKGCVIELSSEKLKSKYDGKDGGK